MFHNIDHDDIRGPEESYDSEFLHLVQNENSEEALSNIKSRPLNKLVDSYGNHLLHVAARFNNVNIINLLINSKCDLSVKDSSGMTALIIAVIHENFDIAKILHAAHLDTLPLLKDDISPWEIPILEDLVLTMKEQGIHSEKIGQALSNINAAPTTVINFHNPVITKAYLQSIPQIEHDTDFCKIFSTIGAKFDSEHIIVILQNAPYHRDMLYTDFGVYLKNYIGESQSFDPSEKFLKEIFSSEELNIVKLLNYLEQALQIAAKPFIASFLQYDFHSIVKAKYDRDILACLFGNKDTKVVELLREDQIDVDGHGFDNQTALHFAAQTNSIENVKMLLELGSDPNAIDYMQNTPFSLAFFKTMHFEIITLLLQTGANPLIGHNRHVFDELSRYPKTINYFYVMNQLAVYYSLDRYKPKFHELDTTHEIIKYLGWYQNQLMELKTYKIRDISDEMLNMYVIMTELPEKLARYVNEDDVQAILTFVDGEHGKKLTVYTQRLLIKRAQDIIAIRPHRKKAAQVISQFISIQDPCHLVVDKIMDYLKLKDFRKLSMIDTIISS